MIIEVTMPKFGLMMQKAIISNWYKKPGEGVKKGEPLFSIETEKVVTDVEAPETGILTRIMVEMGETADVAATVAEINTEEKIPE